MVERKILDSMNLPRYHMYIHNIHMIPLCVIVMENFIIIGQLTINLKDGDVETAGKSSRERSQNIYHR